MHLLRVDVGQVLSGDVQLEVRVVKLQLYNSQKYE
jgi:hypothetical protein